MVTIRLAYSPYGMRRQMRIVTSEVKSQNDAENDDMGDEEGLRQERNRND